MDQVAETTLIRAVIEDVAAAIKRVEEIQTNESRRSAIRTISAAVEGMIWTYRDHVIWVATEMDMLEYAELQAMLDNNFTVDDRGRIHPQPRFLPTLPHLRLLARIAERISLGHKIGFDDSRWELLKSTLQTRNRITHPKQPSDVVATDTDVYAAFKAFDWLCQEIIASMDAVNMVMRDDIALLRHVVTKIREGDADYIAAYNRVRDAYD